MEYNRSLGERRAIAVKDYLISLGISGDRLQTISYGEENPAVSGTGERVWAKNRRADLVPAKMK
jgi:peptidoglycan-associated lipoprotein